MNLENTHKLYSYKWLLWQSAAIVHEDKDYTVAEFRKHLELFALNATDSALMEVATELANCCMG